MRRPEPGLRVRPGYRSATSPGGTTVAQGHHRQSSSLISAGLRSWACRLGRASGLFVISRSRVRLPPPAPVVSPVNSRSSASQSAAAVSTDAALVPKSGSRMSTQRSDQREHPPLAVLRLAGLEPEPAAVEVDVVQGRRVRNWRASAHTTPLAAAIVSSRSSLSPWRLSMRDHRRPPFVPVRLSGSSSVERRLRHRGVSCSEVRLHTGFERWSKHHERSQACDGPPP